MGAINVRLEIIETKTIHSGIDSLGIEVRSVKLRDLAPSSHRRRSYIFPCLACVAGDLDQPIVGACPNEICIFWRGGQRVNHSAVLSFCRIGLYKNSETRRNSGIFSSKIGAYDLPTFPASRCFEENVRAEIQGVRIDWREDQRRRSVEAKLPGPQHHWRDIFGLTS